MDPLGLALALVLVAPFALAGALLWCLWDRQRLLPRHKEALMKLPEHDPALCNAPHGHTWDEALKAQRQAKRTPTPEEYANGAPSEYILPLILPEGSETYRLEED